MCNNRNLARSLQTDIQLRAANGEPLHGQRALLLDQEGRIRGVYDASSLIELRRMASDYRRLLAERS